MRSAVRGLSALSGLLLALGASMTAIAAEDVPTVEVTGIMQAAEGGPAQVVSARVEEFETPESDPVVTPIEVAEDGTFTVTLREWGTPEVPAVAKFFAFGPDSDPVVIDDEGCTQTTAPFGTLELAVPGQVPTEQIVLVLDQTAESVLCPPATATPEPDPDDDDVVVAPTRTLPPTDAGGGALPGSASVAAAALLLGGMACLAVAFLLTTRSSARPGARTVSSTRRRGSRYR
jgi:hypothetical protein